MKPVCSDPSWIVSASRAGSYKYFTCMRCKCNCQSWLLKLFYEEVRNLILSSLMSDLYFHITLVILWIILRPLSPRFWRSSAGMSSIPHFVCLFSFRYYTEISIFLIKISCSTFFIKVIKDHCLCVQHRYKV